MAGVKGVTKETTVGGWQGPDPGRTGAHTAVLNYSLGNVKLWKAFEQGREKVRYECQEYPQATSLEV